MPSDPNLEDQMPVARRIMAKRREALRELAEGPEGDTGKTDA